MPTYEYQCSNCKHSFELFFKNVRTDSLNTLCPECGSKSVKRLFSVFATASAENGDISSSSDEGIGCACGNPDGPCFN